MTTITRIEYDENGLGTLLGFPTNTIITEYDGSVSVGDLFINDAYNLHTIKLINNPSRGLIKLIGGILKIHHLERKIPTSIYMPVVTGKAYTIGLIGNKLIDSEVSTIEAAKIDIPSLLIENSTVVGAYKADLIFNSISSKVCYDFRDSTLEELLWKELPSEYITNELRELLGDTIMIGFPSKYMNVCILCGIIKE